MRLATGLPWDTSVSTLLKQSGQLSVQQQAAYHSILQMYKTISTKEPHYLYSRLVPSHEGDNMRQTVKTRSTTLENIRIESDLSVARTSFFYRASKLWNSLPLHTKKTKYLGSFKSQVKGWIRTNIKNDTIQYY